MNTNATKAAHAPVHPLDPLSSEEMQLACDLVKAAENLDGHATLSDGRIARATEG